MTDDHRPSEASVSGDSLRTAVIVPLAAPEIASAWRERTVPDVSGVPLHVTIIFPFVAAAQIDDAVLAAVAEIGATKTPFAVRLAKTRRFPNFLYIAPEPAAAFVDLVEAFVGRFPQHLPYGGIYDEVIPHLTVAYGEAAVLDAAAAEIARSLPVTVEARELVLLAELEPGGKRWAARARFALGGA